MNTYYEILGLAPGASQTDIKKAYFRLIRQYSPESDPEQFQKIREAYEQLKNMQNAPEGPVFPPFSEPWAENMLKQIEKYRREGDTGRFRDTCEEAWRLFPKDIQFLYLLVLAQRQCGNTGKAVKNAELLVQKEPDNKWFYRELAVSYMERGFTQKAYRACEKAYELGCRDMDFILIYAEECHNYGVYDRGVEILLQVIRQERKWSKEEMPELVSAYMGLLKMCGVMRSENLPEVADGLGRMLEQYGLYLEDYVPELCMMMSCVWTSKENRLMEVHQAERVLAALGKMCHGDPEMEELVERAKEEYDHRRIMEDPRIGETLEYGYEVYFGLDMLNEYVRKYAVADVQLCMLEEREEILKQARILEKEYPDYYEKLRGFLEKMRSGRDQAYLKDGLLKIYRRLSQESKGGRYYEKYPDEKRRAEGTIICGGMSDEPYVRDAKKIGRNDPCPCGSGKKYKHCCMKKRV